MEVYYANNLEENKKDFEIMGFKESKKGLLENWCFIIDQNGLLYYKVNNFYTISIEGLKLLLEYVIHTIDKGDKQFVEKLLTLFTTTPLTDEDLRRLSDVKMSGRWQVFWTIS